MATRTLVQTSRSRFFPGEKKRCNDGLSALQNTGSESETAKIRRAVHRDGREMGSHLFCPCLFPQPRIRGSPRITISACREWSSAVIISVSSGQQLCALEFQTECTPHTE